MRACACELRKWDGGERNEGAAPSSKPASSRGASREGIPAVSEVFSLVRAGDTSAGQQATSTDLLLLLGTAHGFFRNVTQFSKTSLWSPTTFPFTILLVVLIWHKTKNRRLRNATLFRLQTSCQAGGMEGKPIALISKLLESLKISFAVVGFYYRRATPSTMPHLCCLSAHCPLLPLGNPQTQHQHRPWGLPRLRLTSFHLLPGLLICHSRVRADS